LRPRLGGEDLTDEERQIHDRNNERGQQFLSETEKENEWPIRIGEDGIESKTERGHEDFPVKWWEYWREGTKWRRSNGIDWQGKSQTHQQQNKNVTFDFTRDGPKQFNFFQIGDRMVLEN
jgi:hypothetical protein